MRLGWSQSMTRTNPLGSPFTIVLSPSQEDHTVSSGPPASGPPLLPSRTPSLSTLLQFTSLLPLPLLGWIFLVLLPKRKRMVLFSTIHQHLHPLSLLPRSNRIPLPRITLFPEP